MLNVGDAVGCGWSVGVGMLPAGAAEAPPDRGGVLEPRLSSALPVACGLSGGAGLSGPAPIVGELGGVPCAGVPGEVEAFVLDELEDEPVVGFPGDVVDSLGVGPEVGDADEPGVHVGVDDGPGPPPFRLADGLPVPLPEPGYDEDGWFVLDVRWRVIGFVEKPIGWVFFGGEITEGRAATAHDAADTTNNPVVSAAAGRSQPNQPGRLGSRRNRSMTAATMAGSQPGGGSSARHQGGPLPGAKLIRQLAWRRSDCLDSILVRILSSPS